MMLQVTTGRFVEIDAARGLAVFSMITGHFAVGSLIAKPTHAVPYFDGASAFVLLSGVILGIVHRRWIDREGDQRTSRDRLIRRIAVIYLCQVLLCATAVAVSLAGYAKYLYISPIDEVDNPLLRVVMMSYLPAGGDILVLYFWLMCSALALIPMLRRGWWIQITAASVALYVWSIVAPPTWFLLPNANAAGATANWAAWQAVFVPALVVGWKWKDWGVETILRRPRTAVWLSFAAGAVFVLSQGVHRLDLADELLGAKIDFGPGRVIAAWIITPAILTLLSQLLRHGWFNGIARPFVATGARSLDSYVLQSVLLMTLPIALARPWGELVATAFALAVFGACWAWAELRTRIGWSKLHRMPTGLRRPASSVGRHVGGAGVAR